MNEQICAQIPDVEDDLFKITSSSKDKTCNEVKGSEVKSSQVAASDKTCLNAINQLFSSIFESADNNTDSAPVPVSTSRSLNMKQKGLPSASITLITFTFVRPIMSFIEPLGCCRCCTDEDLSFPPLPSSLVELDALIEIAPSIPKLAEAVVLSS